jgi:hypothetical protein
MYIAILYAHRAFGFDLACVTASNPNLGGIDLLLPIFSLRYDFLKKLELHHHHLLEDFQYTISDAATHMTPLLSIKSELLGRQTP